MWTTPNFRERSADAEVTDVNHPSRICDPLVLPRMSSRSDVAPKTARPGRRGAVVTDITKRPRICDPLTLARTVGERRRRGRRSQMCPRCLWAATLPKDAMPVQLSAPRVLLNWRCRATPPPPPRQAATALE